MDPIRVKKQFYQGFKLIYLDFVKLGDKWTFNIAGSTSMEGDQHSDLIICVASINFPKTKVSPKTDDSDHMVIYLLV